MKETVCSSETAVAAHQNGWYCDTEDENFEWNAVLLQIL
jgi:hypothetical protein